MDYKDFFKPETIANLNKKSAENLKTMLGDKSLAQTIMSSTELMDEIEAAEAPYRSKLEKLAIGMVKELYPIIDEENITIDAKIGDTSEIGSELKEAFQPEARRRVINGITQGAALRGAFLFFLFKEHLDDLDPSLLGKYNQILKNSFGVYDDENAIAMFLAQIAQGNHIVGGGSKVNENETPKRGKTIVARAANFPILVHEIIKGLYEIISKKGFKGDKASNQAVVDKVDLLKNEPDDIRYGKFLFDALNKLYINSGYNDPRIREFFLVDVYQQLDDKEFGEFIENAVNEELTSNQLKWASDTMSEIASYLRENDAIEIYQAVKELYPDATLEQSNDYNWWSIKFFPNSWRSSLKTNSIISSNPKEYIVYLGDNTDGKIFGHRNNLIKYIKNNPVEQELDEIKVNSPDSFERLKKNLIKIIEHDKTYLHPDDDDIDLEALEDVDDTIERLEAAKTEEDLEKALHHYTLGEKAITQYYFDLANYKIKKDNPLISEIKVNAPGNKLNITFLFKGYGTLRFIDNEWFGKENWDKYTQGHNTLFAYPYKNYTYLSSYEHNEGVPGAPIHRIDRIENHLNELKRYLALKGIPSQLVKWNGLPRLKIERRYYNLIKSDGTPLDEIKTPKDHPKEKLKNPDIMNEIKVNEPGISAQIIKKYIKDNVDPSNMDHVKVLNNVNKKYFDTNNVTTKMIDSMSPKKMAEYFSKLKKYLGAQSLTEAYSEGTINKTIERWKTTNPNTDETLAKQLIQRFDQVKAGLASKLDILVLPDELKQGQNYLNIDKYSFDDMVKLIRSIPENPDKIKKDAVVKFVQQDGIDRATAQSYVARFMQVSKRGDLKYALENGTENGAFSKEEVKDLIPKRLLASNTYLDPRAWSWQPFEQMLDALFPSQKTAEDGGENLASTDADKVYDKNGIEIYKGDDIDKCISYNPVSPNTKRKKYGWCVTQVGNTNYDYYRFREASPTFYFIFDRDKTSTPEHAPFDDQWHAFVIQVNSDGQSYVVTGGDNRGDIPAKSWEDISKIVPPDTWAKIKDLKDYFKPIALSPVERGRKYAAGKNLSVDEFKELSQNEKELYIQGKASKNQISDDILKVLPQYKIDYEGRSTTLANVAIDSGQKFPYYILKDNEALAKRYAIFRTRHDHPIPLPFVKYLDDERKQTYLNRFTEDNLTFDYIEKFFGEAATQKYVDDQVKKLDYLPKEALRYITDPKIKKFYEIYAKLYSNWSLSNEKLSNLSDEELGNVATMPKVDINPAPMNLKQWQDLSLAERKLTIELAKKYDQNLDYSTLIFALPFVIEDGSKIYALVPTSGNDYFYNDWALADLNGNVVREIPGSSLLGSYDLVGGYPSADDNYRRVWNINDLKVK